MSPSGTRNPSVDEKVDAVEISPEASPKDYIPPLVIRDGDFHSWLTAAGAFIVVFCSSGYVNSFGVYEDFYVREYLNDHSSSKIGWIGGTQTFCLFSMGIFSGYAIDVGYFHPVMLTGSVLFIFCLFMISLSQPQQWYQLFLAQGVGLGIAIGSIYIPALGVVAHHFKQKRSLVMGIVASASSLGGVVHPIMLNILIHGPVGFHCVRISSFMNLVLLVAANCMMRTCLPTRTKELSSQFTHWAGFFSDKTYITATAGTFLLILGVFFPIFYLQLDAVERGVGTNLAFYSIAILNGSSAFGRVVPTIFADRCGVFTLLVPCTLACGILIFATDAVSVGNPGVIVMAILYGFFSGACISLLGPMLANFAKDVSEVSARIGICFGIGGIGSLIGPPIMGALLTSRNIWIRPIIFSGISMCLAALFLMITGIHVRHIRANRRVDAEGQQP
ncbi:MFS general substrate transporter [Dendrothele bispora CBS 962.96]|uniref:MFS general substrate transporter n=1 Tax=Dendrothele bispora (strain CBS 962.96) TaxID=1314807 RepID=A0A4S8M7Y2_DENBC|nr:MFS general substrate transporter [Dendrothele bispora CBS 962.96]